ncbi:LamG domain-containing protein, partial [bacterium]|nr:LamG domain-containing protein [bacterium]
VLVLAVSTGVDAEGVIWNNKTAIPAQGDFAGTIEHTDASGAGLGRFSMAPQGNMLYCNGKESKIWGGSEQLPTAFIVSYSTIEHTVMYPKDYSDRIRNSLTEKDEVAWIGGGKDADCKLLLHFDGTTTEFADATGVHAPVAQGNAVTDTTQKKFGPKSAYLDGIGDYVSVADHADWFMDTGEFSIDFWIRYTTALTTNERGLCQQYDDADNKVMLYQDYSAPNHRIIFKTATTVGVLIDISANWEPIIKTWYHLAIVRGWDNHADLWAMCIDGEAVGTATDAAASPNLTATFDIGKDSNGSTHDGWIDEFRVSKGIARWTSNFNVPVRAYVNASLHWLVGYTRPLQGIKYYLKDVNLAAAPTL